MALTYPQNGDLTKWLKSARKKSAPECPFECGGGEQLLFGQCPNRGDAKFKDASLTIPETKMLKVVMLVDQHSGK